MTFARFMELALYCPFYGYYETQEDTIGRAGDFYTSVSIGNVFGQLLAWQFAQWLAAVETADLSINKPPVSIVEAGAHNGALAKDILTWLRSERQSLYQQLSYGIIEPSARRQSWQQKTLQDFGRSVQWFSDLNQLKTKVAAHNGLVGIIFSNELLDSFPVHRYGWDSEKREWFEWGIAARGGQFIWTRMHKALLDLVPKHCLDRIPENFSFEYSPIAERWWNDAAQMLKRGKLLTFDYGFLSQESMLTSHGTIRGYRKHRQCSNVLAHPGEQDLTAHVNFPALRQAGEIAALQTEALETQGQFLTKLFARAWTDPSIAGKWNASLTRQFQTLVHPEHLGKRFNVLLQQRNDGMTE
jgi:SAM-dependent MidA family methyltransferase